MAQDLNEAMGRLQDMLSTDQGKQDLQDIVSSFNGGGAPSSGGQGGFPGGLNLDLLRKLQDAVDTLQSGNDSRSNLLYALQPYLSASRANHVSNAAKLMSLGKLPDVIKQLRG